MKNRAPQKPEIFCLGWRTACFTIQYLTGICPVCNFFSKQAWTGLNLFFFEPLVSTGGLQGHTEVHQWRHAIFLYIYISTNMKWPFGNIGINIFQKTWNDLWISGALKIWNLGTLKHWNFKESKLGFLRLWKCWYSISFKGILHRPTFRLPPLHQSPSWGTRMNLGRNWSRI